MGDWYRCKYGSLLKSDEAAFKDLFTGVLDGTPPRPQQEQIVHFYSRKYYDTWIKPRVEVWLALLKRRNKMAGDKMPETIDVVSKFRHEVEVVFEHEYQKKLRTWEALLADSPTRSPEEIAVTPPWTYYLQPFIDTIQQRFGIVETCCVDLSGCIEGESECRGVAPVDWARALPGTTAPLPPPLLLREEEAGSSEGGAHAGSVVPMTMPSIQAQTTAEMQTEECDERNEHEREQDEQGHHEAIKEERCRKEWQRDDRAEWTEELRRANVVFEVGITPPLPSYSSSHIMPKIFGRSKLLPLPTSHHLQIWIAGLSSFRLLAAGVKRRICYPYWQMDGRCDMVNDKDAHRRE
ncbi:hypothetical protein B0H14DRAFT_2558862 [Mycena olivaceomarginata]|nr:hypothetical protein B0H14DRAFT_2558862 [Mycena olivaceomarginata]